MTKTALEDLIRLHFQFHTWNSFILWLKREQAEQVQQGNRSAAETVEAFRCFVQDVKLHCTDM